MSLLSRSQILPHSKLGVDFGDCVSELDLAHREISRVGGAADSAEELCCRRGTAGAKTSLTPTFLNCSGEEAADCSPPGRSEKQQGSLR